MVYEYQVLQLVSEPTSHIAHMTNVCAGMRSMMRVSLGGTQGMSYDAGTGCTVMNLDRQECQVL